MYTRNLAVSEEQAAVSALRAGSLTHLPNVVCLRTRSSGRGQSLDALMQKRFSERENSAMSPLKTDFGDFI